MGRRWSSKSVRGKLLPLCSALYGLVLVQPGPWGCPAHCTSLENWNESHQPWLVA